VLLIRFKITRSKQFTFNRVNLLPRGEERFLGMCLKMLEINSQNSMCKNKIVSVI
jgi:hypothetical protein